MTDLTGTGYVALALSLVCRLGFDMLANRPRGGQWASLSHPARGAFQAGLRV